MAVGAKDGIDKRLAHLYAEKQTNNFEVASKIDPEQVWQSMQMVAVNNQALMQITSKNVKQKFAV